MSFSKKMAGCLLSSVLLVSAVNLSFANDIPEDINNSQVTFAANGMPTDYPYATVFQHGQGEDKVEPTTIALIVIASTWFGHWLGSK